MNDDVAATFDDGSTSKTVDGVGTYTVAPDGTVSFVPEPSFICWYSTSRNRCS